MIVSSVYNNYAKKERENEHGLHGAKLGVRAHFFDITSSG